MVSKGQEAAKVVNKINDASPEVVAIRRICRQGTVDLITVFKSVTTVVAKRRNWRQGAVDLKTT